MARILLIDDDDGLRQALEIWLGRQGHEVEQATNGGDGLARLAEAGFDLIITDIIMPDVEGIETIIDIRKSHPDLPIIAMSGGGSGEPSSLLRPAEHLGASATLRKPFRISELEEAIAKVLGPARR